MRFKYLLFVALMALSSCDSREDWFEKNVRFSDLVVNINGVVDTIREGEVRRIEVDLKLDSVANYGFCTDTVNVLLSGIGEGRNIPLSCVELEDLSGAMYQNLEEEKGKGEYLLTAAGYYGTWEAKKMSFTSDTASCIVKTYNGRIIAVDELSNRVAYSLVVNIHGDVPPRPVLTYSNLGDNEYNLSLEQSYDKDGKVEKYEWCIDGNIVSYGVKESRYERIDGDWQSGKAAYGGTYVKATTISNVNHSFQTTGEHTVYYRCMDNLGAWSMWYSEKINVE